MTMAGVLFFLLLLTLFSVHHRPIIPAVSACPHLPSMTVEAACKKAAGTRLMYEVCKDTLRDVPHPSNSVDLYALVGAKSALASYKGTMITVDTLRGNRSLPGDDRDAYASCRDSYREATNTMDGIVTTLVGCRYQEGDLGQVYMDGIAQLEGCRDRVMKLAASPIYAKTLVDRNLAVLAYFLGKLLGVK